MTNWTSIDKDLPAIDPRLDCGPEYSYSIVVLAWCKSCGLQMARLRREEGEPDRWQDSGIEGFTIPQVTHWQPLPDCPP